MGSRIMTILKSRRKTEPWEVPLFVVSNFCAEIAPSYGCCCVRHLVRHTDQVTLQFLASFYQCRVSVHSFWKQDRRAYSILGDAICNIRETRVAYEGRKYSSIIPVAVKQRCKQVLAAFGSPLRTITSFF